MSSAEQWKASSLSKGPSGPRTTKKMGEKQVKVLKEVLNWSTDELEVPWKRLHAERKDDFSKSDCGSRWTKNVFWHPGLWHKNALTWDWMHRPCSALFAILPLSYIQPHLTGTECLQAWPWNNLLRHTQSCFEASRALQASAHMHHVPGPDWHK